MSESNLIDPRTLARATDPETSHKAAHEIVKSLGKLQQWALEAVQRNPGKTVQELAVILKTYDTRKLGRRLPELERDGRVKRTGPRVCTVTNRQAATWEAE